MGKKIRKPASQAPAVAITLRRVVTSRAMASCLQVAADDADEEQGHDVAEDDGNAPARRRAADIVLNERLRIDQESDVGGLQARPAAGGDEDLGEYSEQKDRLDQDHDRDRPRQMRQRDVDEG